MGQVVLKVNGFSYTVGCPDGQEPNLIAMGAELDRRVADIKEKVGNRGEAWLLVMAGVTLADELADLKREMAAAASHAAGKGGAADEARAADALLGLARRLEGVASRLERA